MNTLLEARAALANKTISAVELAKDYLKRAKDSPLNAYITLDEEYTLNQARACDASTDTNGLLHGLPLAIKDLFCTKGMQTTAASHILSGFIPAYESTVTANLLAAGAVFIGKTNLDEFAMGSANITSYYGPVKNPLRADNDPDLCRVPGGSSGGSAAAVAADLCLGATGTDTGGSIRQPAAFCGIVGLKPTYGRCSRWGTIAFASSLDQAGPMTKTVADAALMLQAMAGHDPKDSTSAPIPVPDFQAAVNGGVRGLKIGIPREYRVDGLSDRVHQAWQAGITLLQEAGAQIVDITLPHTPYALPCYYIIAPAEASSNLARYDGVRYGLRVAGDSIDAMYALTRAAGFGAEVQRRILIGTYVLSAGYYDAYYTKAQRVRNLIARDFQEAFADVDAILTPTAPTSAFKLGDNQDDPVTMYLNDVLTVPASMAGLPALSVPAPIADSNGLPLGLQVIGNSFCEETILRVGRVLEQGGT